MIGLTKGQLSVTCAGNSHKRMQVLHPNKSDHIWDKLKMAKSPKNMPMQLTMMIMLSLITIKILLKQSTDESRLKGSGWFELLSILRTKLLMLIGLSLISASVICFKLHFANTATALLHISRKALLFRD